VLAVTLNSLTRSGSQAVAEPSLEDARESLAYWETRARTLPRHAIRRRREAREMAARWRDRVAEAERLVYGRGLLGALLLLAAERRLPEKTRQTGRLVVRRTAHAVTFVCVALVALVAAGLVGAIEVLAAIVDALA
jgi:hypothetical protein